MYENKKITRATFKSMIKKNKDLHIKVKSTFDGMVDGVRKVDDGFEPIKVIDDSMGYNTLGIAGCWLVGGSRDYFTAFNNGVYDGIEVYNCCGSFILAKKVA